MKKFIGIFILFNAAMFAASGPTEQTVIVSHTKSGRHWFQHAVKELTGKRVKGLHIKKYRSLSAPKKSLWCTHSPRLERLMSDETNRLIVPLRNYKELILRYTRHLGEKERLKALNDVTYYQRYLGYVKYYDSWNEKTRLLYYYEDMMTKTEETLRSILKFIDEPLDKLPEFIQNLPQHRRKCFIKTPGRAISYGELIYYSKNIPKDVLVNMDTIMKREAGDLYDKYLKRYQEQ